MQREALRRSTQRASFYCHMGKQYNIITHEKLVLAMWFIEQKVFLFRCRADIRAEPPLSEPARPAPTLPGPAMTQFDCLFVKFVNRYEHETFA